MNDLPDRSSELNEAKFALFKLGAFRRLALWKAFRGWGPDTAAAGIALDAARSGGPKALALVLGEATPKRKAFWRKALAGCPILLFWAASEGQTECVEMLAALADPDAKASHDRTPLMAAASNGHPKAMRALIAAGADPLATGMFGSDWSILMWAASGGDAECVQIALAAGNDPRKAFQCGRTPLIEAARGGQAAAVLALLPLSDIEAKDAEGRSIFEIALASGDGATSRAVGEWLANAEAAKIGAAAAAAASSSKKASRL